MNSLKRFFQNPDLGSARLLPRRRRTLLLLVLLSVAALSSLPAAAATQLLYQNGTFVTAVDAGYGGADLSVVQDPVASSTNSAAVIAWHNDVRKTNRLADDFTVPAGGWHLGRVTLYGYQSYAGTVSTITNVYLQIWNGCPTNPASTVVWGDLVTGRQTNATWTHAYRVLPDELDSARRAVMEVVAAVDVTLPAGTYWLDFMLSGITTNGPYCPPAATNNPGTGNALAFRNDAWQPVTNTLGQGLDFPFVLEEAVPASWHDMAPLPVAVSGAASALVGQKFYLLGGEESPRTIQVCDLLTTTWTADTNGLAADTAHASAVLLGTDLYLIGGDASDLSNAPVRVFHTTSETWETLATDPLPRNPAGVGCAVWDGKIYAFGGEFDTTAYRYDPAAAAGSRWTALANAPAQLMNASVVAVNGKLYVGASTAGDGRQVWVYDPAGDSWAALPLLYYRHAGGQLWATGNTLYVGGGAQGPYVVSYNTADGTNGTWYAESTLSVGRELFAFTQTPQGWLLMAGGLDATGGVSAIAASTKPVTTTTLASSVNPSTFGASVTFTATVAPAAASGTVTFKDGTNTLGTGTLSGGTATYSTSGLSLGDHSVTAEYGGDSSYAASTSSALTQSVKSGPVTWAPGGTYAWEMSDATGIQGVGWTWLDILGDLTVTATNKPVGTGQEFTIAISGAGLHFDNLATNSWVIATVSGAVNGFNANKFILTTGGFTPGLASGTFSVVLRDKEVVLVFTPAPPACSATTSASSALEGAVMVMTFINESGLGSVQALVKDNCTIVGREYNASGLATNLGTPITGNIVLDARTTLLGDTKKVVLWASKDTAAPATVNVMSIDTCGRGKSFDPVITTLKVTAGNLVQQRFEGLLAAEHYLRVVNSTPGLRSLDVNLNGRHFHLDLADGQEVSADLGGAMLEGLRNVVILTGSGEVGSSALVLITDTPTGNEVPLSENVRLALTHTAAGLQLSWPETLTDWQLQSSAAASGDWSNVTTTPAAVDGQLTVAVPITGSAQFYRLHPATAAARPAATGSPTETEITLPGSSQPQPLTHRYDALLW
jgi:hypothetical protein